jgi:mono/diheme cytochrome c family protein
MRAHTIIKIIGAMFFAVFLSAITPAGVAFADEDAERLANDMPIPMDNPDAVAKGKERFGERCGYCHGGGGKGAKGPCLVCGHFKRGGKSSNIYANIAGGVPNSQMGAFGTTLTQDEILNIIAFLRATTPEHLKELAAQQDK